MTRTAGLAVHPFTPWDGRVLYGTAGAIRDAGWPEALSVAGLALPRAQAEHLDDPAQQAATAQPLQPESAAIPTTHHVKKSTQPAPQTQVTLVTS